MAKFFFLCGGCFSGLGKGVAMSALAKLMQLRGHTIQMQKQELYLGKIDNLKNTQHGEVFVTDTVVADLDLGTYQRFLNINMNSKNLYTTGMLYRELFERQDNGKYPGETVQIVPHVIDIIEEKVIELSKEAEITFVEVGGTLGDIEGKHFMEFLRRFKNKHRNDVLIALLAPIVRVSIDGEPKSKPIQNAIKDLNSHGLQADILLCRTDNKDVPEELFDKISDMTGIPRDGIFKSPDTDTIYKLPLIFHKQHMDDYVADLLNLQRKPCRIHKYRELVSKFDEDLPTLQIGIVGKYDHTDAYLSVKEALSHSALSRDHKVNIKYIHAETVEKDGSKDIFKGFHGLVVPGGFSARGTEGKIATAKYARENKVPYLGVCLGIQTMIIEYNRNVKGIKNATSQEFDSNTEHPVIHYLPGQDKLKNKGDTMRLGAYDCEIKKDTIAFELYKKKLISERSRHRLEINPDYVSDDMDLKVSGTNPQTGLIEIMEYSKESHPFMVGSQFHGEFKSSLQEPAPLFIGLIEAAIKYKATSAKADVSAVV